MPDVERLSCPVCGDEMNHHATKIVHSEDEDPGFDGVLRDAHYCPKCGHTELV